MGKEEEYLSGIDSLSMNGVEVRIGGNVAIFRVTKVKAKDLIKLIGQQKRFWEWEEQIETLEKLNEYLQQENESIKSGKEKRTEITDFSKDEQIRYWQERAIFLEDELRRLKVELRKLCDEE